MKKTSKISRLIKIIIRTMFITMFALLLIYNIISIYNKKDYVEFIGYKIFVVKDYQAQKAIKKDTILIAKSKNNNFRKNDLIAIKISAGTYFHRIVDIIGNERYLTKGDDIDYEDKIVFSQKEIEGKIIKQIPFFGKILNIASTRMFSVITILILIITFRRNIRMQKRRNRRRMKKIQMG